MNGQLASIAGRPAEGGQRGSSDDIAAFLHEVAGVGEHQRRRRPAQGPAQSVHRRHAEHRVLGTDREEARTLPLRPETLRRPRDLDAGHVRLGHHQPREGPQKHWSAPAGPDHSETAEHYASTTVPNCGKTGRNNGT